MNSTKLLYLEDMECLTFPSTVIDVLEENGKTAVVVDQTIFYPQGGGQPYDQGKIISEKAIFTVLEVRYFEGTVKHIGTFEKGNFEVGESVTCHVEPERRLLNSRLHSAGHLVDMTVYSEKPGWIPAKGYHFPDGAYVEYSGTLDPDEKDTLIKTLESMGNKIILEDMPVQTVFAEKDKLKNYCRHVPANVPEGKPTRIVLFGDFGVPCGGTHVSHLSLLKHFTIRKIKQEKDKIRVSYDVER